MAGHFLFRRVVLNVLFSWIEGFSFLEINNNKAFWVFFFLALISVDYL